MVFFRYFTNILQDSFQGTSLNGRFPEDSENKTTNVFSIIFASFYDGL